MNEQRIEMLVSGLLDGWLDAPGRQELFDLLREDPRACEVYWRVAGLHHQMIEATERDWSSNQGESTDRLFAELLEYEADAQAELTELSKRQSPSLSKPARQAPADPSVDDQDEPSGQVFSFAGVTVFRSMQSGGYKLKHLFALAACLLFVVLIGLAYLDQPAPQPTAENVAPAPPPILATLSQSLDARWSEDSQSPAIGQHLRAGAYELSDGFVELLMLDGASVLIQAPSRFTLVDTNTVGLESGRLGAEVRGPVKGFVVQTPGSRVTDLGTVFFVEAQSHQTRAYTVDGLITVQSADPRASETPAVQVHAGAAAVVTSGEAEVAIIDNPDPALLARSPYVQRHLYEAGIASIAGDVVFRQDMIASEVFADVSMDGRIVLLPEARGVVLEESIMLDSVWPSAHPAWPTRLYIPKGTAVDTFLLIYKSEGFPVDAALSMGAGSVSFLSAPFGIQHNDANLLAFPHHSPRESEADVARLARYRSEVVIPGEVASSGGDSLHLDPDRKTMHVVFTAKGADAMRVIVPAGSLGPTALWRSDD